MALHVIECVISVFSLPLFNKRPPFLSPSLAKGGC
jgi:hypothetical protein